MKTTSKRLPKKTTPASSIFTIACGAVAVFYVVYRICLIAFPTFTFAEGVVRAQHDDGIVCGEEEGSHLQDPTVILSSDYQKRIQDQKALSSNLVYNSDLTELDPNTDEPAGYAFNVNNATSTYQYLQQDGVSGPRFLRATSKSAAPLVGIAPAWLMQPVTVTAEHTYAYTFWYRSDVPVQIALEYTTSTSSTPTYSSVTTLKPSASWQSFIGHFDNTNQTKTLRITMAGTKAGYVDTRGYTVYQIPDGELKAGIVSVTFDDGWQSTIDSAQPVLDKYHIRTTQYVISQVAADNVTGYMDMSSIAHLKATGNEIGSHSLTHCNQTQLQPTAIKNDAKQSKQILEKNNLGPVTSFAYPLGQYNETTQAIFTKEYPLVRSSDSGYNDRYFDATDIHSMAVLSSTTTQQFQSWIDYAKRHHQWIVLVYHKVDGVGEYNITSAELDKQLSIVAKSGLSILPLTEAANAIRK